MAEVSPRYRIVRRLGQGGMAEVFEGERLGDGGFVRRVAVKQLRADALLDPVAVGRFVDESRIASQLHHAHIVGVLDVGVLDDRPFQVLELVDGLDAHALAQRAGGRLPVAIALMLAHAVAHALDHAHTARDAAGRLLGIVHRDVKPPNILVAWTGDVKLADFGIAVAHDRVAHTETGSVAGTRGFIAPEQRMRGQLDGRSDVFALGLTLHALCTGTTPLADVLAEARLLGGEPLPLAAELPDDVRALIAAAVAPDRRDRPSAEALAATIGRALATRGAGDPRSALRDFVSGVRTPPARPGALDLLLGVELVPLDAPPGTVQRYVTEALRRVDLVAPTPVVRDGNAAAPADAVPGVPSRGLSNAAGSRVVDAADARVVGAAGARVDAAERVIVRPVAPQRRRAASWLAAAALGIAAALILAWPSDVQRTPVGLASQVSPRKIEPSASIVAVSDATAPAAALGPAIDVVDAAVVAPAVSGALPIAHVAPVRRPARTKQSPPVTPGSAAPVAHGYVQVVGEELLRARVLIDGVAVGYVPNRFEVALGHHRVEVERPDGVRLPPRELDVTSFHTAKNPARPSW